MFKEESKNDEMMDKDVIKNLIDKFKRGLIAEATNGNIDEKEYKSSRDTLMKVPELKGHIPFFIKNYHTARDFRNYIRGKEQKYVDRERIITSQMDALINLLEVDEDPFMKMQHYTKLDILGSGGYGMVYRYHNECLDMDFAVKIYEPVFARLEEQIEGEKRFFREAKMMFALNSNYIARIYDAGRIDGKPYIRMELIEGYNLNELHKKEGNMTFPESVDVILHILAGLEYAHKHGVIHRDLRPENVVYSTEERLFKIIDFRVSAFLDTENHTKLTKTGLGIAGGNFIDPLLQENPKLRDVRSDIYSVGAIWYYLLCGRAPSGSDMRNYLKQANSNVQDWEIDMVMKCLYSNIDDRYRTCSELQELLKKSERLWERPTKLSKR